MWIHQYPSWPNFTWDNQALQASLIEIRHRQGRLLGRSQGLGFDLQQEANLATLTNDVTQSSAIEGEYLDREEVRSSLAKRLGIDVGGVAKPSRDIEGIVELMLDATQHFRQPLTKERLWDWHAAHFPTGRSGMYRITVGNWRTQQSGEMQVVSGPIGHEKVHFQAPHADLLEGEMQQFFDWFESDQSLDPVLKAGLAHFWFVTIHPFEDGNGRIGRAIADMALARADGIPERFYSLSTQIEAERKNYYAQLERQQRSGTDVTQWLQWFLDCLGRAILNAENLLEHVLFKADLWGKIQKHSINDRQRLILNRLLETDFEGFINTSKYAKMAKCSKDTALRDIQGLQEFGALIQNPSKGRSTSYRLPRPDELR